MFNNTFNSAYFTKNNTWLCPPNVNRVFAVGAGGGGGGGCATTYPGDKGGGGGGGSLQQTGMVNVIPGTTYNIVIGEGGLGGLTDPNPAIYATYAGQDGYSTQMIDGSSVIVFSALGGGGAGVGMNQVFYNGGAPFSNVAINIANYGIYFPAYTYPGAGGGLTNNYPIYSSGMPNFVGGFLGGLASSDNCGAAGGGAGPQGSGGNGGTAIIPNGQDGIVNSGAGGGGSNQGSTKGGNGGSGYLYLSW